jgi:hypothetical protein
MHGHRRNSGSARGDYRLASEAPPEARVGCGSKIENKATTTQTITYNHAVAHVAWRATPRGTPYVLCETQSVRYETTSRNATQA